MFRLPPLVEPLERAHSHSQHACVSYGDACEMQHNSNNREGTHAPTQGGNPKDAVEEP
jgi:hypothetical protein